MTDLPDDDRWDDGYGLGLSTTWRLPSYPHEPRDEPSLIPVADAYLTKVQRGDLRTITAPTRWIRGAVHDAEGHLVASSQKYGGMHGYPVAMADPARAVPRRGVRRLEGTWLYGGHWVHPFGHFFTETLTTLWPGREPVGPDGVPTGDRIAGIVFHQHMGRARPVTGWQAEMLALAGFDGVALEVVDDEPLRVERLLVPHRSLTVNGWAHPQAATVWRTMAEAAGPPGTTERVYLTRTAFNAARRAADREVRTSAERDADLDAVFAAAGFAVVAPETLPLAEQLRLVNGAGVLAGCAGTALHLSAFAPAGTRVLEIGDTRSPDVRVPTQRVVDRLLDHPSAYAPHATTASDLATALDRLRSEF